MIRIMKYGEVPNSELFARTMPTMNVEAVVADILKNVKERGDEALREYTSRFDGAEPDSLTVTPEEMEEAMQAVDPSFVAILEKAAANIRKFHSRQVRNSFIINDEDGIVMGQKIIPVDRAGLYVPGGTAAYPSTVLMDVIPRRLRASEKWSLPRPPKRMGKSIR